MIGQRSAQHVRPFFLATILVLIFTLLTSGCTRSRPDTRPTRAPTPTPGVPGAGVQFPSEPARVIGSQPDVVPGQVIIKLETGSAIVALNAIPEENGIIATGLSGIDLLNQEFGVDSFEPLIKPIANAMGESMTTMANREPALLGLYVADYETGIDPSEVAAAYQGESGVIYAEPNYFVYADSGPLAPMFFTPNDPFFDLQWNMAAIQAPQAWDTSEGQGVLVAIVDSGIAYEDYDQYRRAPDLANTQFVPGYDFVNDDPHANDDSGHGTHVAGTLAQSTNNGLGVTGVAYNATLMPVKVLDARGQGSFDNLAQGIMFAADQGARVINMSLSGRKRSQLLADAIDYATSKGALVVAAAGNSGGAVEYPAAYENTLAVGAIDFNKNRALYSNFGPQVDVVAPGGDTTADRNGDGYPDGIIQQTFVGRSVTEFELSYLEGTSMAAPHVSGLAALLFAANPATTAEQVRQVLQSTCLDLGQAGRDDEYGYGLIQASVALATLNVSPPATTTPISSEPPATPLPLATATSTPAAAPTVISTALPPVETPTPVTGETDNLIVNGSFDTDAGWIFGSTQRPGVYTDRITHSGQRAAALGILDGIDEYSYSSVYQTVTIPSGVKRATLTFWTYPISQDVFPKDVQLALLIDENFHVIVYMAQALSNAQGWIPGTYDLTPYAGRTLIIYFGVFNDGGAGGTSAMYLDDVALTVER